MIDKQQFQAVAKQCQPKKKWLLNCTLAFLAGGLVGILGQAICDLLCNCFDIPKDEATSWMLIIVITITSILTALGVFDKYAERVGAGAFVPITGFANSLTSATIDSRSEGLIQGIGANIFKLSGSVILYGTVSAYFVALIRLGIEIIW